MIDPAEKIVKVHVIETSLQTVQDKSLVIPESKGKYDIEKIVELMHPQVPFVDKSILAVLIRTFNEKVIELASNGYHIDTGLVHLKPVITGTVPSGRTTLKDNKFKVVAIPCKSLRDAAAKTKLRVSRKNYRNRYITDATNPFDTHAPVTENGYVELTGCNLKIMGDFPDCGVWLENTVTKKRFQIDRFSKSYNKPKSLMFKLPDDLCAGSYNITVVTCFCGTKRLLSTPTTLPNSVRLEVLSSAVSNLAHR